MRFVLISQAFRARLSSKVYETTEAAQDTPGLDRVDLEDTAAPAVQAMLLQMAAGAADPAAKALREVFIGNMPDGVTDQVRRTPCRRRSWANFSVL